MKSDLYLKSVLTVIALCLVMSSIKSVPLVSVAKAKEAIHCSGTLKVNPFGATSATIGGYNVNIDCM